MTGYHHHPYSHQLGGGTSAVPQSPLVCFTEAKKQEETTQNSNIATLRRFYL